MIKPPPNIGVLLGESLSGLALGSKRGRKESPFYHKTLARRLGVYRFAHERAVSGLTQEAAPAVLSGLLPHNREGKVQQLRVSLASEFKARNYTTGLNAQFTTPHRCIMSSMLFEVYADGDG